MESVSTAIAVCRWRWRWRSGSLDRSLYDCGVHQVGDERSERVVRPAMLYE